MPRIRIIGVGPGTRAYLTPSAQRALEDATVVAGGRRHLEALARPDQKKFMIKNNLAAVVAFLRAHAGEEVAILASGDPGLYGILSFLRHHFTPEELEVIPGISPVQLAFARLAMPWHDAVILSAHGRSTAGLVAAIRHQAKVALLTGPGASPDHIARLLQEGNLERRIYCCCNLGYPDEVIISGLPEELAARDFSGLNNCVMVILDETKLGLCDSGHSR
ncbi:MAG: precorrin-6y C5,15-methyltransferase (decarboxylating) subunit CbiE [Thermoanaerobacteraceae bacterium]|nr:precorrin-6y C5,15-methyltransferase (decarboxylating) subunit CbiE [Thermoanaerobacteraceae bacterium]